MPPGGAYGGAQPSAGSFVANPPVGAYGSYGGAGFQRGYSGGFRAGGLYSGGGFGNMPMQALPSSGSFTAQPSTYGYGGAYGMATPNTTSFYAPSSMMQTGFSGRSANPFVGIQSAPSFQAYPLNNSYSQFSASNAYGAPYGAAAEDEYVETVEYGAGESPLDHAAMDNSVLVKKPGLRKRSVGGYGRSKRRGVRIFGIQCC